MRIVARIVCIAAASLTITAAASADTKLIYQSNGAVTWNIAVRGDLVRWEFAGDRHKPMTFVYDNKRRHMSLIHEKRKRIYEVDDTKIAEQRAMDARRRRALESARRDYNNMSPERRRRFEKRMQPWQLRRLKGDGPGDADPATVRKGRTTSVNGYVCQFYDTMVNEQPRQQVCVAERKTVRMSPEDYGTLIGLFAFLGEMAKTSRLEQTHFARNLKGVPVQMKDNQAGLVQTVKTIDNAALPADVFKLPPYEIFDPGARRKRR